MTVDIKWLLVALIATSNGQILDYFLPQVAKTTRQLTSYIAGLPIVHLGAEAIGNSLVSSADLLSRFPIALARAAKEAGVTVPSIGNILPSNGLPTEMMDQFLKDFNAGSGNDDATLRIDQLINKYGYPFEKHEVETDDGYLLTMFRIPGNGVPVFLMHGLLASSDDFVIAGPNKSLSYLLANRGYDVWMGNARGNKHSRTHKRMKPSDPDFWDFTWHEIGVYDLPAMIDYILDERKSTKKIKYIGHSQGTTTFFVMMSERPDYNEKVTQMVALSPVAFMGKVRSPLVRLLAPGGSLIYAVTKSLGVSELLPDDGFMKLLKTVMCGTNPVSEILCNNIIFLIAGFDYKFLDVHILPVLFGHLPAGCAMKQVLHYAQGVLSEKFRKFDFGPENNIMAYGKREPPRYALHRITVPIAMFYSDEDWLAHPDDVDLLYDSLGNPEEVIKVSFPGFNHLDFVFAKYFNELVFDKIKYVFELYEE